jgi:nicotinamidase-related amidase
LNSFFCQQAKGNLEVVQQPIFLAAFGLINTQIKLEVKVAPGAIPQTLIVQEIKALQATWVIFDRFVFVTNDHFFCFQDLNFLCVLNANLILVCAQNGTCAPCGSKIVVKESKLQTKS